MRVLSPARPAGVVRERGSFESRSSIDAPIAKSRRGAGWLETMPVDLAIQVSEIMVCGPSSPAWGMISKKWDNPSARLIERKGGRHGQGRAYPTRAKRRIHNCR